MFGGETGIPVRYVFTLLGFLGFVNLFTMKANLSVAMVALVKSTSDTSLKAANVGACKGLISNISDNSTILKQREGEFEWDLKSQSLILGAFFYGYIITLFPGGVMAEKFGAKWLYGIGVLIPSIFTLLTPLAARMGVPALVAVRFIEGLSEGATTPAMNSLIAKWAPRCERSRLSTIIYTGCQTGTVLAMGFSGMLSASTFLGGWPSVFYVFGFWGCIWFVFWSFIISETPSAHPRISASELTYINSNQESTKNIDPIPWKGIFSSIPVWALALTHLGNNWGFYTLFMEMPTYLSNVLHFDIAQNGILSAIPFIVQTIVAWTASFLADKMIEKGDFKITTIRKIFNSIGFFGPGLCILGIPFAGCRPTLAVVLLSVTLGLNGFINSGFIVTHVDMSSRYAGILMGLTSAVANVSGFLAPAVVGLVVDAEQSLKNWKIVFIITSTVYFVFGVVYNVFCTSEIQSWGDSSDTQYQNNGSTDDRNEPVGK